MAVGTALKIGTQVIKNAPKLQKLTKLTKLQKVIKNVKSTKNVIQSKINLKQNLPKIAEKIGDIRNNVQQSSAIRNLNSSINKTVNTNMNLLKNRRALGNANETSKYLRNYFGFGKKVLPANASKLAKLKAGLGPIVSKAFFALEAGEALYDGFRADSPKVRDTGNIGTILLNPVAGVQSDQSITNNIRNLASDVKHIGNRNKYKRTDLAGASMLKFDNTWWNPFDDNYRMVPNEAMKHNKRAEALRKLDTKYGNPNDKKKS